MAQASEIPNYDFFHPEIVEYVARKSAAGARWVERYRRLGADRLEAESARALQLLRQRRLEEGRRLLESVAAEVTPLESQDALVAAIATRWLSSVFAYQVFLEGDLAAADEWLKRAESAIAFAISEEPALLPFVHHCADFTLQRARMARESKDWLGMRGELDRLKGMNEGSAPLCVLPDGREIRFPELSAYYSSMALDGRDRGFLRSLLDDELRLFMIDRAVRILYVRASPVIVY